MRGLGGHFFVGHHPLFFHRRHAGCLGDGELRLELTEDLFTMALCARCEDVVPVLGDYVPFGPAGLLVCGPCLGDGDNEPAGPAILHP
jgi:hypothetical protein